MPFNYSLDFTTTDFREHPELYRVGVGEQGVLMVQPYKSEILPFWKFKTPEIATESSKKIYELFLEYLKQRDFVGADMARKYLQMGYTRSRRYANHASGRKYKKAATQDEDEKRKAETAAKPFPYSSGSRNKKPNGKPGQILPVEEDFLTNPKAQSAKIFYEKWQLAKSNSDYMRLEQEHQEKYEKQK